jgi:hypothetical protein
MHHEWGSRDGVNAFRMILWIVRKYVTQPSDVIEFEESNAGMIANLPIKMQRSLREELARVGARVSESDPSTQQGHDMKASDAFPSKYLAAADLNDEDMVVKITHIQAEEVGGQNKFILFFAGQKKGLVLNKTNWNTIATICGEDSDDWTGQQITLFPTQVDFQGETVDAIRVKKSRPKTTITTGKQSNAANGDPRSDADME